MPTPLLIVLTDTYTGCTDTYLDARNCAAFDRDAVAVSIRDLIKDDLERCAVTMQHWFVCPTTGAGVFIATVDTEHVSSNITVYGTAHQRFDDAHVRARAARILE